MAMNATNISADPNIVYRKNFSDAYCRCSPPHTPIMKYIGSSTTSKNTKNRIRSWAMNVPAMPVCKTSIKMKKAFGLPGSGTWFHEYTITNKVMTIDNRYSGRLMPSRPTV